ncbi:MAG: PolC-type DNA polymerase III [Clostridiales bacterium]|nr:PolC-type DNA polymerase III [Clostridiales bacterium]
MATISSMFNMDFGKYSNCNITNTSKSVGRAEIEIEVDFIVNYTEIAEYEKTLATKYRLETFRITPKYIGNTLNISNIDSKDLLTRITTCYPGFSSMLKDADIEILPQNIKFNLKVHGADILKARGVDRFVFELIKNTYGLTLSVTFDDSSVKLSSQEPFYYTASQELLNEIAQDDNIYEEVYRVPTQIDDDVILGNRKFAEKSTPLSQASDNYSKIAVEGKVLNVDIRELRTGKILVTFGLTDLYTSVSIKFFIEKPKYDYMKDKLKDGIWVRVLGSMQEDKYTHESSIFATHIYKIEHQERMDTAEEKRVELHLHTQMSAMDGVSAAAELVKRAADWGHKAIAITDHGVLQGYPEAFAAGKKHNIKIIYGIEGYLLDDTGVELANLNIKEYKTTHIIIWVKNYTGLKNLYKLVSLSNLEYFYKKPRLLKSLISEYREGLLISSACEAGDLYRAIVEKETEEKIEELASFYDYLEIQPLGNNRYMLDVGMAQSEEEIRGFNRKVVALGEKLNKPVIATGDVHFLEPWDEVFRRILMAGQGYEDADRQAPLYLKTTTEMLEEFSYLGEDKAYEIVVTNPNKIADLIEEIVPIPQETCPPHIEGAEEEIKALATNRAKELYGDPLPQIVKDRLDKELNSIIKNGFSVMYIIAQKLVAKSLSDGYLVGSRGSVGSSFVATMSGITEVNPLPAHYLCKKCKHSEFVNMPGASGCDLPKKNCPNCGAEMSGEGNDIPFETFLGFDGDKEPDIDLNFSGEYQPVVHKYTEELFGEGHVFRAGTIGTIADKTAYGFVKKYLEAKNMNVCNAEVNRLVAGCAGVKRTTGQHPGGVIIVPRDREVYDFCPIQRPADDTDTSIITTHFDYHFIHGTLLKLDILGHDDPTVIRMLEDLTGIDAKTIEIGEPETMELFRSTKSLGISPDDIHCEVGSFAVPEFGTRFVRQMLLDTKPTTFAELVRISGLSHGTDVWLNNAQELIKEGKANLSQVICTRDDIMLYLISKGLPSKVAFKIMEDVRKGKGVKPEYEEIMNEYEVPDWYIDSCKKIKYMFPKAHAAAYVMMAFRIAWFKVHYPREFYATYFTVRADDFDSNIMTKGKEVVERYIKEYEAKGNEATTKEKNVLSILEVCNEMYARGIKFLPFDLYESDATKFLLKEEGILPPLNALGGLGVVAAENLVKAREEARFSTWDDIKQRGKASKTVIDLLEANGCLVGIPRSNQISLFG